MQSFFSKKQRRSLSAHMAHTKPRTRATALAEFLRKPMFCR